MNEFSYHILPTIHSYNAGISWLRSEDLTLVERCDSGRMRDSGRKMRHRSEVAPPVLCPTSVGRRDSGHMPDSGRKTWLWSYARLQSKDMTLVVYPDSGRTSQLWSTSQLRSYIPTSVVLPDSDRRHDSDRISRLQSCITTPVVDSTTCLTHLWKTSHGRARWLQHLTV
jgi:hypothetical protein